MNKKNTDLNLIFIFGLLFIILNFFLELFKFNFYLDYFGWFVLLIGGIIYFFREGKPFRRSWNYLRSIKTFIWLSVIFFFVLALIGFLFPIFFQEQIKELVNRVVSQTEGLSTFDLIKFIFLNNLQSSFTAMITGLVFCFISATIAIVNGYVLGFVANKSVGVAGFLILWKLLPHGIFEIPAILISVAMGLKLGTFLFVRHKNMKRDFYDWLKNCFRVFIFIVIPLLVIAAIIEGSLIILLG